MSKPATTGLLPVLLFMHGLICLATAAAIGMSWLLGAFPTAPELDATIAVAAALATAGVATLLVASFQILAGDLAERRRDTVA